MKSIRTSIGVTLLFVSYLGQVLAQPILSKEEAVAMVILQNYDVLLAENNRLVALNNTDKGAIGYLPIVDMQANGNLDYGNSFQEFASGNEIRAKNVTSVSGNASVGARYDLYVGGSRDLTLERLLEVVSLADLQKRQAIESSVLQMLVAYYNVANLTRTVQALQETLVVTSRRLQRASYSFEYGQGNRLQVLNAEVDLNRDSINLRDAIQQLENAKRDVNVLLAREVNTDFAVDTNLMYATDLDVGQLRFTAIDSNVQVLLARRDLAITDYDARLNETTKFPTISLNGSLGGNISKNLTSETFINYSTRWGPALGVSVGWNIFDGGLRRVNRENIRIQQESQQLVVDQLQQQLDRDIQNAWEVYQNALYTLQIEEHNLETNQDNFERTQEQFNIGQVTSVEFRQAQFNLVNAEINLSTARYTAKVAELRLLQLAGKLFEADY